MLVEDDNNLREIYGARLLAEGYEIVSAQDGEEALALAVKEKPDLIISDVMMPRISGFDMLDILRNAPETKNTKVIMMTALSQAEDKARADKLGADRYLVKSQVTLEDVTNVVHEVLGDLPGGEKEDKPAAADEPQAAPNPAPVPEPVVPDVIEPAEVTVAPEPEAEPAAENPAPVADIEPAPSVPDAIESAPEPEAAPEIQTVEAIANPVVDVAGEPDTSQVQAPPSAPEPEQPDPNLPPIVEPSSIKVELPSLAEDTPKEEAATPAAETPAAPEEPKPDFVGPSLAEALATEEEQATDSQPQPASAEPTKIEVQTTEETAVESAPPLPTDPVVVSPTQQPPEDPVAEAPSTSVPDIKGEKVILPINDGSTTPDINELLAAEERKAAVNNPVANTVITPGELPKPPAQAQSSSDPVAQKKNDDLDNISL